VSPTNWRTTVITTSGKAWRSARRSRPWGLWLSDRLLRVAAGNDLANVEHLPLLALVLMLFALVMSPATHAWSRRAEYRADRSALEMTRDPAAFVGAMRKLAGQEPRRPGAASAGGISVPRSSGAGETDCESRGVAAECERMSLEEAASDQYSVVSHHRAVAARDDFL